MSWKMGRKVDDVVAAAAVFTNISRLKYIHQLLSQFILCTV